MATTRITITLPDDQVKELRALVAAGEAANVSAFVKHAVGVALLTQSAGVRCCKMHCSKRAGRSRKRSACGPTRFSRRRDKRATPEGERLRERHYFRRRRADRTGSKRSPGAEPCKAGSPRQVNSTGPDGWMDLMRQRSVSCWREPQRLTSSMHTSSFVRRGPGRPSSQAMPATSG